jgi:hypothetical protein
MEPFLFLFLQDPFTHLQLLNCSAQCGLLIEQRTILGGCCRHRPLSKLQSLPYRGSEVHIQGPEKKGQAFTQSGLR